MTHIYTNPVICSVIKQFDQMKVGEQRVVKFFASMENRKVAKHFASYNFNERKWKGKLFTLHVSFVLIEGEFHIKRVK